MDIFLQRDKHGLTEEAIKRYKEFKVKPNDVIINTPPKCGTTWIQMICQSLRSKGDMSFEDINEIIPFVITAYDAGIDLEKDQGWKPHVFKYHEKFENLPMADNVKYILCIRNPIDAAISNYYFQKNWLLPDEVPISEFIEVIHLKDEDPEEFGINIWTSILNFYPRRHDTNVLYLHYEDLKENLRECVKMIANFLEIEENDELIDLATEQADINFMKKHQDKFDIRKIKIMLNKNIGLDPNTGLDGKNKALLRSGKSDQSITKEMDGKFEIKWKKFIEKELGFESYNELRKAVNKELKRPFLNST